MTEQRHLIQKFIIELQVHPEKEAYSLQSKCNELVKGKLLQRLDPLFNNFFERGKVFRIEKLEIDLGAISIDDIEKLFVDRCLFELSEQLGRMNIKRSHEQEPTIERLNRKQTILDQFFYFLQMGQLPWSAMKPRFDFWQQQVLQAIEEEKEYFTTHFSTLVADHPDVIDRLLQQFDGTFIVKIVYSYEAGTKKEIFELLKLLMHEETKIKIPGFIKRLSAILMRSLFQNRSHEAIDQVRRLSVWLQKNVVPYSELPLSISLKQELELSLQNFGPFSVMHDVVPGEKTQSDIENEMNKVEKADKNINKDGYEQAVYIDNAGLVLLHPFLPGLFEELGYTAAREFLSADMKCRAVHMLQFIVNGEEEMPEYFLSLNKLFCAMENDEHIDRFIRLTDAEKDEAIKLIQAVIGHWTVLKNTSVEGLQQGFLQRHGKLSFNAADGYWKLQIEKTGIDVLLEKLPWGFSYIQLPWMKYSLITEW